MIQLLDSLWELHVSQTYMVEATGLSRSTINDVIHRERAYRDYPKTELLPEAKTILALLHSMERNLAK